MAATKRQQKQAETAQRLFETALRLFMERGYHATTVEMITEAAQVAKGTFFNYFASKDAVLGHIGQIQMERLRETIANQADFATRSFRDQLLFVFDSLALGVEKQPDLLRAVVSEMLRNSSGLAQHEAQADLLEELLLELVQVAQARGELVAAKDPKLLAALVRDTYFSVVLRWLRNPEGDFKTLLQHQIDLVFMGIGAQK